MRTLEALQELRRLTLGMVGVHLAALLAGYLSACLELEWALEMRTRFAESLATHQPIQQILSLVREGMLVQGIALTFGYNLTYGALLASLAGVFPPATVILGAWRAFYVGLVYCGTLNTLGYAVLVGGTVALEFTAYSIASAAGIKVFLSALRGEPRRGITTALRAYPWVVGLLLAGAVWEILGLRVVG